MSDVGKWTIQKWPEWLRVEYLDNVAHIKELEREKAKIQKHLDLALNTREVLLEQVDAWWMIKKAEETFIEE